MDAMFTSMRRGGVQVVLALVLSGVFVRAGEPPATTNASTTKSSAVDAAAWVESGDALYERASEDVENIRKARAAWDQALVVDPQNRAALDRLMKFWTDVADMDSGRREVFTGQRTVALKILEIDPENEAALVAMQTSIIRPWLIGQEQQEEEIVKAIDKLVALTQKFPTNVDIPLFTAQAKLKLSERRRGESKAAEAKQLSDEADQIIAAALERSPSAATYFAAAQLAQLKEALGPANVEELRKKKHAMYADAMKLAKPDDPMLVSIYVGAARANANTPQAEAILRELNKRRPDDPQARLALIEQLALTPRNRVEALELADEPVNAKLPGVKAYLVREMKIRTLVVAMNLRLEMAAKPDQPQRAKLMAEVDEKLVTLAQLDGQGVRYLRLRGKLLRNQGKTIEAIQTLEKARALGENLPDVTADRIERWEVIDLLARMYIETNQNGRARDLLTQLVSRFPTYDPARVLLVQLLLREGKDAEARPHIDELKRRKPNDPDVIKMELQLMNMAGAGEADKAATLDKMPENSVPEILDKVNAAMVMKETDTAKQLLGKAQKLSPGSFDVARLGVRVYRALGDMEGCKRIVADALAANPSDENLKKLQSAVEQVSKTPVPAPAAK